MHNKVVGNSANKLSQHDLRKVSVFDINGAGLSQASYTELSEYCKSKLPGKEYFISSYYNNVGSSTLLTKDIIDSSLLTILDARASQISISNDYALGCTYSIPIY